MNAEPIPPMRGRLDASLSARVVSRRPLYYDAGADLLLDRPSHVRAGSGLAWFHGKLAIAQDDTNFLALVDPHSGTVESVALPAGEGELRQFDKSRGNKKHKHDFEAIVSTTWSDGTDRVLLFGSGSTPRREHVALIAGDGNHAIDVVHAPALYRELRACRAFAGSELNIEGAVRVGDVLRVVGRGNGELADGIERVNATCDLEWAAFVRYIDAPHVAPPPLPHNIVRYELGELRQTRLTFTDACAIAPTATGAPRMLFTATGEASADTVLDGPVSGSVIGLLQPGEPVVRWAPVTDSAGATLSAKIEGIAVADEERGTVYVVVDADDHELASELWEVELKGVSFSAASRGGN